MLRNLYARSGFATTSRSPLRPTRRSILAVTDALSAPSESSSVSDHSLPWGSLPVPNFGKIRDDTGLTPGQMDSLVREYLPHDSVAICKQRNKINKSLRRHMKQKNYGQLQTELDALRANIVPLDEVTYVTMIFGHLQLRNGLAQADAVLEQVVQTDFVHPSLKRLLSGFLTSLKSLEQFDAFPNTTAILKAYLPFMEIATEVRRLRLLGFRVAMSDRIKKGEIMLDTPTDSVDIDDEEDDKEELDLRSI